MRKFFSLLLLLSMLAASCSDNDATENGQPPVITWAEASARFRVYTGETLMLVPDIEGTDETTTYRWTMDGKVVSTDSHYSFTSNETGEFFIRLAVTNRYGSAEDEVKVTVSESENAELPALPAEHRLWCFPWTEINIAQGRAITVKAYLLQALASDSDITWTLDGQPVTGRSLNEFVVEFPFSASTQGVHILNLTLQTADTTATQDFTIHVCAPAGTYRRGATGQAMVNQVYEYMPAPGHQVNGYIIVGDSYPDDCTHEQACDSVLAHFSRRWSISLGSQGGYLIAGFDHSVTNSNGDYDLCIKGNPFSYQSEPGIIWVSQDDNGDGLPNDQWFELAGSEYGTERHTTYYAITYYRPAARRSATAWRDIYGQTGYVPYLSYWNPHDTYWQPWVEGSEHTFFSSRLADRSTYVNGYSDIPPYDWGYVDNLGSDFVDGPAGKMNYFRLSNARYDDGQPARLDYIDFIKIQTAQTGSTPNLGDISTEIYYISDYHLE